MDGTGCTAINQVLNDLRHSRSSLLDQSSITISTAEWCFPGQSCYTRSQDWIRFRASTGQSSGTASHNCHSVWPLIKICSRNGRSSAKTFGAFWLFIQRRQCLHDCWNTSRSVVTSPLPPHNITGRTIFSWCSETDLRDCLQCVKFEAVHLPFLNSHMWRFYVNCSTFEFRHLNGDGMRVFSLACCILSYTWAIAVDSALQLEVT